jgi:hypothetical protein
MLAQAFYFGFNVGELSCPTRYEPESSSISLKRSVKYGFGVLATTLRYRLQKWGLAKYPIFDSKGERLTHVNSNDESVTTANSNTKFE